MSFAEKHFDDGIFFAQKLQQEAVLSSSKVLSSSVWVQSGTYQVVSMDMAPVSTIGPRKGLSFLFHHFSLK